MLQSSVALPHERDARAHIRFFKERSMAEKVPQSLSNHARFDPPFHFFVLPVFAITVIIAIVHLVQHPESARGLAGGIHAGRRGGGGEGTDYALKVQDRVIRLEERLRLAILVDKPLRARIVELTESQFVGLRFASDAELPALAARALSEKLSKAEIKKAITQWRPDYWRV